MAGGLMPCVRVLYRFDVDEHGTMCLKSNEATYYVPRSKDVPKVFNRTVKTARSWRSSHKGLKMIEVKAFTDGWELVRTWYTGRKSNGYWEEIGQ